jgi:hypothetical protein
MRALSFCRRLLLAAVALAGCLSYSMPHAQSGQVTAHAVDFDTNGIRFRLAASVKADPEYAAQSYDRANATLATKVRISAHAIQSQFFGNVTAMMSDFSLVSGSPEQVIWQEARCHQRRGLPKETVVAIDGAIATEQQTMAVHARARQLGLMLPADEITQGIRLPEDSDRDGAMIAYRSQTKLSHLFVDVKMYGFDCKLNNR